MVVTDESRYSIQHTKALQILTKKIKKLRTINASLRNKFLKNIESFDNEIKVVSGKFVLKPKFYEHLIKSNNLNEKMQDKNKAWKHLFDECRKAKLIHKSSSYFSKGLRIVSINPNVPSLFSVGYSHVDQYIEHRDSLYTEINGLILSEKNKLAYKDLRLYQIMPLSSGELERINTKDITFLNKDTALLYVEHSSIISTTIPIYTLIRVTGKNLVGILEENFKADVVYPFADAELKSDFGKYKKRHYGSLHISAINMTARNIEVLSSSPVQAVIAYDRTVVSKLTLSEVYKLHPNRVPEHLLSQEVERVLFALQRPDTDKESSENEAKTFTIKDLEKLQELMKIKTASEFRIKISGVKSELSKYLADPESLTHGKLIVHYILHLLDRVEKRNKIAISTFKGYLGILDKHLFSKVEDLGMLQPSELDAIISGLFRLQYKGKSIRKIRALVMSFFKHHKQNHMMANIDTSSVPKSLIFKDELAQVLEYVAVTVGQGFIRQGKSSRFYMLEIQALVILAFYTGLRKSELRSRLLKDVSIYGDKIYVDVNTDGLKRLSLKLKTSNAKRRVCAIIDDVEHLKILNDFFEYRGKIKNKSDFLFLKVVQKKVSKDDDVHVTYDVKSKALSESEFDEISIVLQSITGRHVTFHSLRHSYASYEVKRIIDNPSADPHQLIDLAIRMGHESPETTLKVYTHRSVLDLGGAI